MWVQYSWQMAIIVFLFCTSVTQAAIINNGDFSDGFNGWVIDTDGFSGASSDFTITSDSKARIEADYYEISGDTFSSPLNTVFFGNSIYQNLDVTSLTTPLNLQFSYDFNGQDGNPISGDRFSVYFSDMFGNAFDETGSTGFIIDPTSFYGSGHVDLMLDPTLISDISGLSLTFLLEVGADEFGFNNAFGSYVEMDNVTLTPVPIPATLWLFATALIALTTISRKR